ncbi:MAG: hypothetical protein KMY53_05095 [Desulfarculus sp.]|nr:hypothetical protein [Pseudomonadota bacterium]MBU4599210.1 hypothetical protein [Pseudomonadota bacterium]MBV1717669.1 hypothetical protein [Desulfarculus sp.]MBV1737517.1 hypothetical protein [Desulfarculus sp.]
MARDDFPGSVRDILAKRVGMRCSNPSCQQPTTGPRSTSSAIINIGVAAHITAASSGGPRYNFQLSPTERQSAQNGIWLCQNCAKLIDNDELFFTVELLNRWKESAEGKALKAVKGKTQMELPVTPANIELFHRKVSITLERHDYLLEVRLINKSKVVLGQHYVELVMPSRVLKNPECHRLYISDRSTRETAFFRVASQSDYPEDVIYPGDPKVVITVNYFITNDIYMSRGTLLDTPVKATLYIQGHDPITDERPLKELQNF